MSYLTALTLRLAAGATQIPEPARRRHAAYLAGLQGPDGGFPGRQGPSDLYYTGFALRGLALLGELPETIAARAAGFLQANLGRSLPSIDFLSLATTAVLLEALAGIDVFQRSGAEGTAWESRPTDRKQAVLDRVLPLRRGDGGYAKTPQSRASSTYHTFLIASCLELVGAPLEDPTRMADLAISRRREDGGFVELPQLRQSGTNPTAAAIGLLRLLGALDETTRQGAARFLAGMQNAEAGLRANTRIPLADLLSTFTGLVALADLGCLGAIDAIAARRYVEFLEQPGGFRGGAWDDATDAEYTFYGLGTLALLNGHFPSQ